MRRCAIALAAFIALAAPAAVHAATVYYSPRGDHGIESVSGKIVRDTEDVVEVLTKDGRTVSIRKSDVYQIIPDRAPAPKNTTVAPAAPNSATAAPAPPTSATGAPSTPGESAGASPTTGSPVETGSSVEAGSSVETGSSVGESSDGTTVAPPEDTFYSEDSSEDTFYSGGSSSVPEDSGSRRVHHFGLKAGMNVSNMSVDPQEYEEGGSLKSFAFGGWWGMPLNRRLTLQTEAIYSVKGDQETEGGYTTSTHMSYIDVPVLAKLGFLHGSTTQPSLFLGPSLSVNVSANAKLEGEGSDVDLDVKDQVRPIDFGLVVGGGVDFLLGARTCGVEVRYSHGLSNAAGDEANGTAHNSVLAVMGSIALQ